jgi:hypothetical protein
MMQLTAGVCKQKQFPNLTSPSGLKNIINKTKENPITSMSEKEVSFKNVTRISLKTIMYVPVLGNSAAMYSKFIQDKKTVKIPTCHCHLVGHPQSFKYVKTNIIESGKSISSFQF